MPDFTISAKLTQNGISQLRRYRMAGLHIPRRYSPDNLFYAPAKYDNLPIRLFGKVNESIVDGPGLRMAIFTQGCPHGCEGCHNPLSHSLEGGTEATTSEIIEELKKLRHLDGVTFSGGEPFLWSRELYEVGRAAHDMGLNIMTYTGYTWEVLRDKARTDEGIKKLLTVTDTLVDGRFVLAKRDITLKYRGSSNQRILDLTCYPNSENATERFDLY